MRKTLLFSLSEIDVRGKWNRSVFLVLLLFLVLNFPYTCHSSELDIWSTSPWISMLAEFIGGIHVSVHSMENWDDSGERVQEILGEDIPGTSLIIALDIPEAERSGIVNRGFTNLKTLYTKIPVSPDKLKSLFYDPSTLPFLAQRIMNVLSGYDPAHYAYYQRRLAEFQTRLDSTVLVGRQLLAGTEIILERMDVAQLFIAAGCSVYSLPADIIPPPLPEEKVSGKRKNKELNDQFEEGMEKLIVYLKEEREKGIVPVLSAWIPSGIGEIIMEKEAAVMLPRPSLGDEFILFLNDHYLALWNEIRLLKN